MSNRVSVICSNPTFRDTTELAIVPKARTQPVIQSPTRNSASRHSPTNFRASPYSRSPNHAVLNRSPLASPGVKTEAVYLEDNLNFSSEPYQMTNQSRPSIIQNCPSVPVTQSPVCHIPYRPPPVVPTHITGTNISGGVSIRDKKAVSPPLELDTQDLTPLIRRGSNSSSILEMRPKISLVEKSVSRPKLSDLDVSTSVKKGGRRKGPVPKLMPGERCSVCGDKATGFHYKVVSCEGCKGFFRRACLQGKIFRCKGEKVGECMSDPHLQRKCKDCRFQKCLEAGMRKEYLNPNKTGQLPTPVPINSHLHLDSGKQRFLEISTLFWDLYVDGFSDQLRKRTVTESQIVRANMQELKSPSEVMNTMVSRLQRVPQNAQGWSQEMSQVGAAQRMNHFVGMASYHVDFLSATSEDIPFFSGFDPGSKKALLREAVLEIILLRAAACHNNNSVRSINGASYDMNTYRNGGVSAHFTQIMKSLIGDVQKLKLTKEEVSLMAIMILLTPDRGTDVIQRDKRQLANIQECFSQILLAVLARQENPENPESARGTARRFGKLIDILVKLRTISSRFSSKFNQVARSYKQSCSMRGSQQGSPQAQLVSH